MFLNLLLKQSEAASKSSHFRAWIQIQSDGFCFWNDFRAAANNCFNYLSICWLFFSNNQSFSPWNLNENIEKCSSHQGYITKLLFPMNWAEKGHSGYCQIRQSQATISQHVCVPQLQTNFKKLLFWLNSYGNMINKRGEQNLIAYCYICSSFLNKYIEKKPQ